MEYNWNSRALPQQWRVGERQEMLEPKLEQPEEILQPKLEQPDEMLQPKLEQPAETFQTNSGCLVDDALMMEQQRVQFGNYPPFNRTAQAGCFNSYVNGQHRVCQLCQSSRNEGKWPNEQRNLDSGRHETSWSGMPSNYFGDASRSYLNWPYPVPRPNPWQIASMPSFNDAYIDSITTQDSPSIHRHAQQTFTCLYPGSCTLHTSFSDWGRWKGYHWPGSTKANAPEHIDPRVIAPRPSYSMPSSVQEWSEYPADNDSWSDFPIKSENSTPSNAPDISSGPTGESFLTSEVQSTGGTMSRWRRSSEPSSRVSFSTSDKFVNTEEGDSTGSGEWQILPSNTGEDPPRDDNGPLSSDPTTHLDLVGPTSMQFRHKDDILIEAKNAGLSYKEIRRRYSFTEAESTLRGRYRCLTKPKEERVRKPVWQPKDIELLQEAVSHFSQSTRAQLANTARTSTASPRPGSFRPINHHRTRNFVRRSQTTPKIPWSKVAAYIFEQGGSYRFGNATCRKKWDEVNDSSK